MVRKSKQIRKTNETEINLELMIDGTGKATLDTGVGFFNHMLDAFTRHGLFNLNVTCQGDLHVDDHHTVEDVGIVLGRAFREALGDMSGMTRYATVSIPMDEAIAHVSVDISGRPYLVFQVDGLKEKIGTFDTELVEEFFRGFVNHAGITLHIQVPYGKNSHHIVEAIFKGVGRSLRYATEIDRRVVGIPSTKGTLSFCNQGGQ